MSAHIAQLTRTGLRRRVGVAVAIVSLTTAASGVVPLVASGAGEGAAPRVPGAAERIHHLEFEGYVASRCTRNAMVMVNPATHRRVTVTVA
jgi:hypothetical protein